MKFTVRCRVEVAAPVLIHSSRRRVLDGNVGGKCNIQREKTTTDLIVTLREIISFTRYLSHLVESSPTLVAIFLLHFKFNYVQISSKERAVSKIIKYFTLVSLPLYVYLLILTSSRIPSYRCFCKQVIYLT